MYKYKTYSIIPATAMRNVRQSDDPRNVIRMISNKLVVP